MNKGMNTQLSPEQKAEGHYGHNHASPASRDTGFEIHHYEILSLYKHRSVAYTKASMMLRATSSCETTDMWLTKLLLRGM